MKTLNLFAGLLCVTLLACGDAGVSSVTIEPATDTASLGTGTSPTGSTGTTDAPTSAAESGAKCEPLASDQPTLYGNVGVCGLPG